LESGQAQNQEGAERRGWEKQELRHKPLVDLTNKTNWQRTYRQHRPKLQDNMEKEDDNDYNNNNK
jgi:hypothetical protein